MDAGLSILNVGAGDTKLSFDKDKPAERERACRIVTDMLRRGYAILVQVGEKDGRPLYQSASGFDPETAEYLIAGLSTAEESEIAESVGIAPDLEAVPPAQSPAPAKRGSGRHKRLPADKTKAVGVARSAGG